MFSIELVFSLNILKSITGRIEYELSSYKIVSPMFQAPDDGIKFFIIS